MHFYCLKAAKNYKNAFKLTRIIEINYFNSCLYIYCINNRINLLTVTVDSSKVPPIIKEGQSYAELFKNL